MANACPPRYARMKSHPEYSAEPPPERRAPEASDTLVETRLAQLRLAGSTDVDARAEIVFLQDYIRWKPSSRAPGAKP